MALVVTRKKNEKIVIETEMGEKIIINVADIRSPSSSRAAKTVLAIQASRSIRIDRAENLSEKVQIQLSNGQFV
jgi:sRNA-binding carbon storage regulator CsrA